MGGCITESRVARVITPRVPARGSRHHARVAPAAVARAAVHVVRVRCPLLVWIPTTQIYVNQKFASKCEQIYLN